MKLLWLSLADPDPPTNGQFLYSAGLIGAAAATGAQLQVIALDRAEGGRRGRHRDGIECGQVAWSLVPPDRRSRLRRLLSLIPAIALRTMTREMRRRIAAAMGRERWDAIVFDSLAQGWALPLILRRHGANRPRIVYLSHNHEAELARIFAREETRLLRRIVKRFDAFRVARLESALAGAADLVTANTPEDRDRFAANDLVERTMFLPPGYTGFAGGTRTITEALPRRALIVGTFDWAPKRRSLEAFLAVADERFAAAGIELLVVGNAETNYLDGLRRNAKATRFTGRVDDVAPYLREARLALVPDLLGGFKLKTLDYIFNGLPIFAIAGAAPGLPLSHRESIVLASDHRALAQLVIDKIDDVATLDRLQKSALDACRGKFEWPARGAELLEAIGRLAPRAPQGKPAAAPSGFGGQLHQPLLEPGNQRAGAIRR